VTVAVLREPTEAEVRLDDRDLEFKMTRGSGAGGQHRNKTDSCVQLTHLPTGTRVRVESERSQHQNRANALTLLAARLLQRKRESLQQSRASTRREQVGSGMRGDKIRTISMQRDDVTDHRTGKSISTKAWLRGDLTGL